MKAVLIEAFAEPLRIADVPDPTPVEGAVVVKVEATGVCRSDWHGWIGHDENIQLPHVPGHELAGTIVAVGKGVSNWKAGDRVTVPFVGGCGACPQCQAGHQQVCDHQFQPGFNSILGLRKRGKHVQVGLMLGEHSEPAVPMAAVIANELEILGSHGMPAHRYDAVMSMILAGKFKLELLVGQKVSLEESIETLVHMDRFQGVGTTVITEF